MSVIYGESEPSQEPSTQNLFNPFLQNSSKANFKKLLNGFRHKTVAWLAGKTGTTHEIP